VNNDIAVDQLEPFPNNRGPISLADRLWIIEQFDAPQHRAGAAYGSTESRIDDLVGREQHANRLVKAAAPHCAPQQKGIAAADPHGIDTLQSARKLARSVEIVPQIQLGGGESQAGKCIGLACEPMRAIARKVVERVHDDGHRLAGADQRHKAIRLVAELE